MDCYKNRDQEIAPTDIAYRDFVFSCGSGLLTAIVGIIEDRDQETAHTNSRNPDLLSSQSFRRSEYPCTVFSVA